MVISAIVYPVHSHLNYVSALRDDFSFRLHRLNIGIRRHDSIILLAWQDDLLRCGVINKLPLGNLAGLRPLLLLTCFVLIRAVVVSARVVLAQNLAMVELAVLNRAVGAILARANIGMLERAVRIPSAERAESTLLLFLVSQFLSTRRMAVPAELVLACHSICALGVDVNRLEIVIRTRNGRMVSILTVGFLAGDIESTHSA